MKEVVIMGYYSYLIMFVIIFLICYFLIIKPKMYKLFVMDKSDTKKKPKKTKRPSKKIEVGELNYLVGKFNLKQDKLNWQSMSFWISLIDSFIISFVVFFIEVIKIKYLIVRLVIAFVLLFALIYALYEIYGRFLKNRQEKEN